MRLREEESPACGSKLLASCYAQASMLCDRALGLLSLHATHGIHLPLELAINIIAKQLSRKRTRLYRLIWHSYTTPSSHKVTHFSPGRSYKWLKICEKRGLF